jgi:butyryl-CoA dehydrogenase
MDDRLSEDERAVREAVSAFAREELAPDASAMDESGTSAGKHLPRLADLGLMGMNLPQRWGGAGVSPIALSLAVEAVAGACASTASMITAHFLATDAILLGGDDRMRERHLPPAAVGIKLGAFALTEPEAGSDPADMRSRAVADGDGWRLKGVKQFISNAGFADFAVVFAKTDSDAGHRGISGFVIDLPHAGVEVGKPERTMGLRGGHVFALSLDCHLPADSLLGDAGTGFRTAMRVLDRGRVEVGAMCVGIAQAALDAARAWALERRVSGRPIADFQGIQWKLADMATDVEAARLLTQRASARRGRGERFSRESAMAKLFASEMAARVTDQALQIHGGYGYTRDLPLERYVRDVRIMRICEGSSEIQRNIIARSVLAG